MKTPLRSFWHGCLDLLFPPAPRCFFCQRQLAGQAQICLACLRNISHPEGLICRRCGRPLPGGATTCPYCVGKTWAFTQARSVGPYSGELRLAVHRLKFRNQQAGAPLLAQLMFQAIETSWWPELNAIVPVPLHPERFRQRGYNQAELLAYELSLLSNRPMLLPLERCHSTPPQVGLSQQQRRSNMQGAFALIPGCQKQLHGKRLLLVDDVLTTGSTLDACARSLLEAGCQEVRVVTIAITNKE